MCGILGVYLKKDSFDLDSHLQAGIRALHHRGPDDVGFELHSFGSSLVALGQVRLSIIDLSSAGHQPMHSNDGRWTLVFNGEIYNYRELRTELQSLGCRFSSNSDTEVLLAAWTQWGTDCLTRLTGMFAFVVLDQVTGTLTCVRDAFGIKPFFYTSLEQGFRFASETPALLELLTNKPKLNWQRAYDYLVYGDYDSTACSFFEGIYQLPPGHLLTVDLASGQVSEPRRWWSPKIQERDDLSLADAIDRVRASFLHSIRLHLRSDVPLGAALSGGIDSSGVVCAMRHLEPDLPIHTFSFIAADSAVSEERWVDKVNARVGGISHKVMVTSQELALDLDDMIRTQGEPFGSTSIYAQYRVFKLARECGVTVTLDGQGADEMLAGYFGYPGQRLRSLVETGRWNDAWQFFNAWPQSLGRSYSYAAKAFVGEVVPAWLHGALRSVHGERASPDWINVKLLKDMGFVCRYPRLRPELIEPGRRVMAELAQSLTRRDLPALLRHGDRNSMRFSVESRVPFLTLELVELLLSLPEHYLISQSGETKSVFRAAMRGIVPDEILDRKDKIGFQTPEQQWLMSMAGTVREWLRADIGLPFLDQAAIVREFDNIIAGKKAFSWKVWRWINFIRWHQHFLA